MSEPLVYHWSPSSRRDSILATGLRPGHPSTDALWVPGYVCFADSPSLAWALSAGTARGRQHPSWDLWMARLDDLAPADEVPFDDEPGAPPAPVKERRCFRCVPPEALWLVGSRTHDIADRAHKQPPPAAFLG